MAKLRVMMAALHRGGLARDNVVNTFYLDTDNLGEPEGVDYDALANDAIALWGSFRPYPSQYNQIGCRIYNMGDDIPREPRADRKGALLNASATDGMREAALCLSFYGDRNLPRQRGRLYIGPWPSSALSERPDATVRGYLGTLAAGIGGLGGINVDWCVHSPTTGSYHKVTNWWVDDEWDVQRRRGHRPSMRLAGATSE
jgi:hypothetical protein